MLGKKNLKENNNNKHGHFSEGHIEIYDRYIYKKSWNLLVLMTINILEMYILGKKLHLKVKIQ